jgi:hypothetical protein
MIQAALGEVVDNCPNLEFGDITDYSDTQAIGTYSIHNYSSSTPAINTEFTITDITIDSVNVLSTPVVVLTDPSGNLFDPEGYYQTLIDTIEATQDVYRARLVKPTVGAYRTWYLELFVYGTGYDGLVLASVSQLTPEMTNMSGGEDIDFRNISLYSPEGVYLDLGGVVQEDVMSFLQTNYTVGTVVTLTYCDDSIVYTVGEDSTRDCVIKGIIALIDGVDEGNRFCSVCATQLGATIVFTAREPGVPFTITVGYSLSPVSDYFTIVGVVANQPTMSIPANTVSNTFTYAPEDRGGKYLVTLTIGQGCDVTSTRSEFFNWCFDRQSFDCCFISLITKTGCCEGKKSDILSASNLRNIIRGIGYMQSNSFDPNDIQRIVDSGWSICEPLNCSGTMKVTSNTSGSGDCGCGCNGNGNCK